MEEKKKKGLTERIFGRWDMLLESGYTTRSHVPTYHSWYFSKLFTFKQLWVLEQLFGFITQGKESVDPWTTRISMRKLGKITGQHPSTFTPVLKKLATTLIKCPICDKDLRTGVIDKVKLQTGQYEINLSPYLGISNHLQKHYVSDIERFMDAKNSWLQKGKKVTQIARVEYARCKLKENREEKELKESQGIYQIENYR